LELENVKRVKAVSLTPSKNGLTTIGGMNKQGKTSILDAIVYGLGGEKYRPTKIQRVDGVSDAKIDIKLNNGIRVTRSGKNASLKVLDTEGKKGGQKLLDSFIDELSLNITKFLSSNSKEKAAVLLRTLGIEGQLSILENEERKYFEERTVLGRIADQKIKYAAELIEHHDAPELPVSASELLAQCQDIMRINSENQTARSKMSNLTATKAQKIARKSEIILMLAQVDNEIDKLTQEILKGTGPIGEDKSTAELEKQINDVELINSKVRDNLNKAKANDDAAEHSNRVAALDVKVRDVRDRRTALLLSVPMPLEGLSVENGELVYNGQAWDCMSSMEQIRCSVAIVRKLKPDCGFVLIDKIEQFDVDELAKFGAWLEAQGLQAICTRVSTGDECSVIIEDGMVKGQTAVTEDATQSEDVQPSKDSKEEDW
jgi:hypothetical protein